MRQAPVGGDALGAADTPVPILLVGDELPAAVSDYLSGTNAVRGGMKTHQSIVAIGGTAVVSDAVMASAVAAAKTSAMLTATIKADIDPVTKKYKVGAGGGGVFTVTYSDDVKLPEDGDDDGDTAGDSPAEVRGTVLDPTMYELNGRRIEAYLDTTNDADEEAIGYIDLVFTADRTVSVELSHILEPGDTIRVVGGGKVGANGDMRKLEDVSLKLGALPSTADTTAPTVEILAVAGETSFDLFITEANILNNDLAGTEWSDYVKVTAGNGNGAINLDAASTTVSSSVAGSETGRFSAGDKRPDLSAHVQVTGVSRNLAAGDVITVERSAVLDKSGKRSALKRFTVKADKAAGKFEISRVSIGDYKHLTQASADIETDKLLVTAKATGKAAGAVGNGWAIYGYDDRVGGSTSTTAFNIDVAVDMANRVISYTISDDKSGKDIGRVANISDLASELVKNSDFNANFSVAYKDADNQSKTTALEATTPSTPTFTGGTTAVGIEVRFNDAVEELDSEGATLANALRPAASTVTGVVNFLNPDNVVHISYTASSMAQLPMRKGFRVIAAGAAENYSDVDSVREILDALYADSSVKAVL